MSLHATFLAAASAVAGVASTLEQRDTLACTWRENLRRLDEHEYHIRAYRRVLDEAAKGKRFSTGELIHDAEAVATYHTDLARHCAGWRRALRAVVEAEAKMDRLGMAYAKSSADWRD